MDTKKEEEIRKEKEKNLEIFENYVLKKNEEAPTLYILSGKYFKWDPTGTNLSRISIFDKNRGTVAQDREMVNKILSILITIKDPKEKQLKIEELKLSQKEMKGIGSMLGMAIGDAMGARYEFEPVRYDVIDLRDMGDESASNFGMEPGQWTDDTSMGLCIADSLLMNNGKLDQHDIMHRFLCWWKGGLNNAFRFDKKPRHSVGLGGNISLALRKYPKDKEAETSAGDKNTSGNGSIMRNGAIPICYSDNIENACEMARKQSLITHQGLEAKECCSLLTHIVVKIINGEELKDVLNNLDKSFHSNVKSVEALAKHQQEGDDENRNWNWMVKQYKYSPYRSKLQPGYIGSYAMDNMAMSLNVLYTTNSFEEALIKVVNIRGDSDSVASVVGQIAGAYYPIWTIPGDWIQAVYNSDRGEIALRGYMLARLKEGKSFIVEKK